METMCLTMRVWDVSTGQLLQELKGHDPEFSAALSPDGKSIIGIKSTPRDSEENRVTVLVWDVSTGELLHELKAPGHSGFCVSINSFAFSPDSKSIICGCMDNTVRVWDVSLTKQKAEGNAPQPSQSTLLVD
jgi:WD40 repeat protein